MPHFLTDRRGSRPAPTWRAAARLSLLSALLLSVCGCAELGVQPWERDLLARPAMQLVSSPLDAAADDHTYFSKEAATGGRGFGGGGCGCN
ncbi:MAG: hypothetical protein RIQ60_3155 [Pseudomonadota bacterium]|jgi:hypothetical protein